MWGPIVVYSLCGDLFIVVTPRCGAPPHRGLSQTRLERRTGEGHHNGVLQQGDTTGEPQRENDAK